VYRQQPAAFWDYHDWIFAHQGEITVENLKDKVMEWAKGQKDLDALKLNQCMETKATDSEVQRVVDEGRALAVSGTRTLFVNGRQLVGQAATWANLRQVIDYEIEYQKTAKNAGEDCGCEVKLPSPALN